MIFGLHNKDLLRCSVLRSPEKWVSIEWIPAVSIVIKYSSHLMDVYSNSIRPASLKSFFRVTFHDQKTELHYENSLSMKSVPGQVMIKLIPNFFTGHIISFVNNGRSATQFSQLVNVFKRKSGIETSLCHSDLIYLWKAAESTLLVLGISVTYTPIDYQLQTNWNLPLGRILATCNGHTRLDNK